MYEYMATYMYIYIHTLYTLYIIYYTELDMNTFKHTYIQLCTYALATWMSSITKHAEIYNGRRHKEIFKKTILKKMGEENHEFKDHSNPFSKPSHNPNSKLDIGKYGTLWYTYMDIFYDKYSTDFTINREPYNKEIIGNSAFQFQYIWLFKNFVCVFHFNFHLH